MRKMGILLNAPISHVVSCSDFFWLEVVPARFFVSWPFRVGMYAWLVPGWCRIGYAAACSMYTRFFAWLGSRRIGKWRSTAEARCKASPCTRNLISSRRVIVSSYHTVHKVLYHHLTTALPYLMICWFITNNPLLYLQGLFPRMYHVTSCHIQRHFNGMIPFTNVSPSK